MNYCSRHREREEVGVTEMKWTEEKIIEAIRAWAASHDGVPPTSTEWLRAGDGHPAATTVGERFGSWAQGIEAAGFVPVVTPRAHKSRRSGVEELGNARVTRTGPVVRVKPGAGLDPLGVRGGRGPGREPAEQNDSGRRGTLDAIHDIVEMLVTAQETYDRLQTELGETDARIGVLAGQLRGRLEELGS